jgi:hypothetical protein
MKILGKQTKGEEPSLWEAVILVLLMFTLMMPWLAIADGLTAQLYTGVGYSSDASSYIAIAQMIRHEMPWKNTQFFLGLPSAIAAVSAIIGISEFHALVTLNISCSIVTCILACRLYGGSVAVTFSALSLLWLGYSAFGGSEPLFVCLLLGSFVAARGENRVLAALLASLATTVRPIGVLSLIVYSALLLWRGQWRPFRSVAATALAVAIPYLSLVRYLAADPFISFRLYSIDWGPRHALFSFPLRQLTVSTFDILFHSPWTLWLPHGIAICLTLVLIAGIWHPGNASLRRDYQHEMWFATAYVLFFLSYNLDDIAWAWPRFMVPVLPVLLFSVRRWLPVNRWVLWPSTVLCSLLALAKIVHFKHVFGFAVGGNAPL